jgi:hypothetical protein
MPTNSSLFAKDTSPEQIVKMTLAVLYVQHQREAERLKEILSGFDELHIEKLVANYEAFLEHYKDPGKALATLTKIIAAELDGGDCPIFP